MEDTLRYFFSAVFQGFAAVISIGIMFYLYYMDRINKKIEEIENSLIGFRSSRLSEEDLFIQEHGLISFIKEKILPKKANLTGFDSTRHLIEIYDGIKSRNEKLKTKLIALFKLAISIILISLLSLFCIGYYSWINRILFLSGLTSILLSFVFFYRLFSFIKDIIGKP